MPQGADTAPNAGPSASLALRDAVLRLRAAGLEEEAPRDARALLAFAMGLAPDRLTLHLADLLDAATLARFDLALHARAERRPVSQIIGNRLFWGRSFLVTQDTLDPRPETEILIEAALQRPFVKVLDLGTGTGCILLSLLADRPMAQGMGVDLSPKALEVARANATRLGLQDRVQFQVSDWFGGVTGRYDLIVSNPPYIAADEMAALSPEVRLWEPHLALTPGADGLAPYRILAAGAGARLMQGGRILLEIGPTQGEAVSAMLVQAGFEDVHILPDFDGRDRVVLGVKPGRDESCTGV